MNVTAKFIPNPDFRVKGEYKRTSIDNAKESADMLIKYIDDRYTIDTKGIELKESSRVKKHENGFYAVTYSVYLKLNEKYNIMADL